MPSVVEGLSPTLARFSFFVYVFFLFFPTSPPFQDKITSVEDLATASPINQLLFSSLYLLSFLTLLRKREALIRLIRMEKFLCLFLLWSLLTVAWSDFPWVSFKRWFQSLGSAMVMASALLYFDSPEESLPYLQTVLVLYLPLTLLAILLVPGAIQWEFPAWRGLAEHKNTLGQISLVSLITWSYAFKQKRLTKRVAAACFWGLSLALLLGARSTTPLVAAGLLLLLSGLSFFERVVARPVVGKVLASFISCSAVSLLLLLTYLERDLLTGLLDLLEKDMTLTGRTDLWATLFEQARDHLAFGCGFAAFWVVGSPPMDEIVSEFPWVPTQAHSGYLDLLNETGIVGVLLLGLMVVSYGKRLLTRGRPVFGTAFFLGTLIVNVTESTLFRSNVLTAALFTFSYLSLHLEMMRATFASAAQPPLAEVALRGSGSRLDLTR